MKALFRTNSVLPAIFPALSPRAQVMLRVWAVVIFTGLLAPAVVSAQTASELDSRLSRVERVLDQSLLEQLRRVDGLERELRELRGENERLNNEISTLQRRNRNLNADTEERLTELEAALASGAAFGADPNGEFGVLDENALSDEPLDESPDGLSDSGSRGVFVREGGGSNTEPTSVRTNATQAEKAAYTRAYDLLARGQNRPAVTEFDLFLDEYPNGPYSFNAWYWKGEAKYAERRFDEAIEDFRQVTDRFPTSTKVPDARLKIGFALYEQGRYNDARLILEQVQDEFQGRSAAVLARKRLQKMDREGL